MPELRRRPSWPRCWRAGRRRRPGAELPGNPVAQLVLADADAKAGHWAAAEARFAGLPRQGLTQVLRPLLVAWAQQGAGRTDAALATLQPFVDGGRSAASWRCTPP